MPKTMRVVVPLDSQDPKTWGYALAYAMKLGEAAQPPAREYVLLTHAKTQLKDTSLAGHVGKAAARTLLANDRATLSNGAQLRHATLQTLRGSLRGAVVIAYFAEDGMLRTLDGMDGVVGVVAVPDHSGDADGWIARWNPVVHGQPRGNPAPLVEDAVVAKALAQLSGSVNLAHAIMNPRDKAHADETLRILRAKGHELVPEGIESWAIRNGWKPGAAGELARLAEKIGALKAKPSLGGFHDPERRYESWSG